MNDLSQDIINSRSTKNSNQYQTHLLVIGDCKMPEIDYNDYPAAGLDFSFPLQFFNLSQDLFLIQHVLEATRFRGDQTPSKLDYVFTNEDNLIESLNLNFQIE